MNYIPNLLHFYSTTEAFEVHKRQGLISPDSICFLGETGQIFTQGAFIGICKERFEKLEQLVLTHDAQIKNILGIEGPSVGDGVVNNFADLVNFLDGFTDQDNLKDFLDALKNVLESQITEVNRVLSERITALEDNIRNDSDALHTALDGINSKIDTINVRLDAHDTSISALNIALSSHIREYNLLKTNYENFKSYSTTKFNAIDSSISSLTISLNTLQQYFEDLDEKFDDVENEVSEVKALLEDAKKLVQEVEDRFGETLAALEQFKRDINEKIDDFKSTVGAPDGIAPLDGDAKVPSAYLPSYVDDVLEYATKGAFPVTGETGKIYVSLDDNLTYRWSGSTYIEISKSLGLGETATTAYPGNKGKKNADDIVAHKADYNNPHRVTKAQLGLDKVNNTSDEDKPISTAQQAALDVLTNSLEGHINDKTNPHDVTKAQVGLGNVDNTSDLEKPISTATQNVLDTKVDKIVGKGLSTNDFTNEDKARLDRATTLNDNGKINAELVPVDEEDLTVHSVTESNKVIRLKDRDASKGMGYKILRLPEDGILTQDMINEPNTIYEIRYDFDLNGATINIPENCVLKFEGGSLSNGTLFFRDTRLLSKMGELSANITIQGISRYDIPLLCFLKNQSNNWLGLKAAYESARTLGCNVDWSGVSNVTLDIPPNSTPIELTKVTDFKGATINIVNNTHKATLFSISTNWTKCEASTDNIVKGVPSVGKYIAKVQDENAWTERSGYNYSVKRKDLIVVNEGFVVNSPIFPYSLQEAPGTGDITTYYSEVGVSSTVIKNLIVTRKNSTYVTTLLSCDGIYNLVLDNISIYTDNSEELSTDTIISITNSANVRISNIYINGLYDKSGYAYGFNLDNCYNTSICNVNSLNTNWGIFGNNNLNRVSLENCSINRFDIHCYGKDISISNCTFHELYNQFSSIFGYLTFNQCMFENSVPVLYEPSYRCYTNHKLTFNNCLFDKIPDNCIVRTYDIVTTDNNRPELRKIWLPSVSVKDSEFNLMGDTLDVFMNRGITSRAQLFTEFVNIQNVKLNYTDIPRIRISRYSVPIVCPKVDIDSLRLIDKETAETEEPTKYVIRGGLLFGFTCEEPMSLKITNSKIGFPILSDEQTINIEVSNSTVTGLRYYRNEGQAEFNNCDIYLTNIDDVVSTLLQDSVYTNCKFYNTRGVSLLPYKSGYYKLENCKKNSTESLLYNGFDGADELVSIYATGTDKLDVDPHYVFFGTGVLSKAPNLNHSFSGKYLCTDLSKELIWDGTKWIDPVAEATSWKVIR